MPAFSSRKAFLESLDLSALRTGFDNQTLLQFSAISKTLGHVEERSLLIDFLSDNENFSDSFFKYSKFRLTLLMALPEIEFEVLANEFNIPSNYKIPDKQLILSRSKTDALKSVFRKICKSLFHNEVGTSEIAFETLPAIEEIFSTPPAQPLFEHQASIINEIEKVYYSGTKSVLVQIPTGSGKTRTAMEFLIRKIVSGEINNFIWLAHSTELLRQAENSFKTLWQTSGKGQFVLVRELGHGLSLGPGKAYFFSFQEIYAKINGGDKELLTEIAIPTLAVFDEAHKLVAPTYRMVFESFKKNGSFCLGLSATPGRGVGLNKENRELVNLFSKKLIGPDVPGTSIKELRENGILSRLIYTSVASPSVLPTSLLKPKGMEFNSDDKVSRQALEALSLRPERNEVIFREIEKLHGQRKPTIVFSCGVWHSRFLAQVLRAKGISAVAVDGKMPFADRLRAVNDYKGGQADVIINFMILSTGFDAPRTKAVVICRPTSSIVLYSQMIGRALRGPRCGGSIECDVVDISGNNENFGDEGSIQNYFKDYWES